MATGHEFVDAMTATYVSARYGDELGIQKVAGTEELVFPDDVTLRFSYDHGTKYQPGNPHDTYMELAGYVPNVGLSSFLEHALIAIGTANRFKRIRRLPVLSVSSIDTSREFPWFRLAKEIAETSEEEGLLPVHCALRDPIALPRNADQYMFNGRDVGYTYNRPEQVGAWFHPDDNPDHPAFAFILSMINPHYTDAAHHLGTKLLALAGEK